MRFDQIDLKSLAAPDLIEEIDYETLLKKNYLQEIARRAKDFGINLDAAIALEQSPTNILSQVFAYAEMILRQRVNQAARGVMLSSARGTDLDHLGALFGTARMITPDGTPEEDDRFRRRIQLALEAFSTAGSYGAYVYHALKATTLIKDVSVYGPETGLCLPGQVLNVVLSEEGDGSPSQDILDAVQHVLSADDVRPLTDQVLVYGADIQHYSVDMTIYVGRGPDTEVVRSAAIAAIDEYTRNRHGIGRVVAESGIKAAGFKGGGVERIVLANPPADIDPGRKGAAYCDGIEVTVEVIDGAA